MNTQNPHIRTTPDTDKSVTNSSLRSRVKKGFTRRLFFRRTAEATGALALAGGNATLLTACTNMAAAADPAASSHATTIASAATAQNKTEPFTNTGSRLTRSSTIWYRADSTI